jgi:hypothetical protein
VPVLRDKLARQQKRGLSGRDLYTSYANLGTFLIHANMGKARAGDKSAENLVREGLGFLYKSIEVNPDAHFGREIWQAVTAEWLLACIEDPTLLDRFDLTGNRLDAYIDPKAGKRFKSYYESYGPSSNWLMLGEGRTAADYLAKGEFRERIAKSLREEIPTIGAEAGWDWTLIPSQWEPVPFDEPVLGIIGMWRQGGGANPHFALCLGEIMLRVGQRYLAWAAYERTASLAKQFWPDPVRQEQLIDHCRARQKLIEATLPPQDVEKLRPRYETELAYGLRYQKEYQADEAAKLAAGRPVTDPELNADFVASHPPIASPVGPEDQVAVNPEQWFLMRRWLYGFAFAAFGAGLGAFAAAVLYRRFARPA